MDLARERLDTLGQLLVLPVSSVFESSSSTSRSVSVLIAATLFADIFPLPSRVFRPALGDLFALCFEARPRTGRFE